jgi:hypothetical protein
VDLKETGCGCVDWIYLAQNTFLMVNSCEFGNEPSCSLKDGEFLYRGTKEKKYY